jgi:hypothetical protein
MELLPEFLGKVFNKFLIKELFLDNKFLHIDILCLEEGVVGFNCFICIQNWSVFKKRLNI